MKEALKLALELAIMHHSDDGYAELRSKVRQLAKEALAQPEQPSFNEWTNAKLASHYFDLLKVVERYEKHGVTCQTFRHFVTEPCAECNCVAPITAIKEALAQPEQEQSGFFSREAMRAHSDCPDYTTPPKRQPLTDDEINKCDMCGYVGKDKDSIGQCPKCRWDELRPLVEKARQKPLTDDQIYDMYNEPRSDAEMLEFARAIEAALGIKE